MENKEKSSMDYELIYDLNKVDGFNPADYISTTINDRGEEYTQIETKYKMMWFRLCYPNGRVSKKIIRLDENVATVEAKVYLNNNDPEESYVGSGFSQKFSVVNGETDIYYLESAITTATGKALGEIGFGIELFKLIESDEPSKASKLISQKQPTDKTNVIDKKNSIANADKSKEVAPSTEKTNAAAPQKVESSSPKDEAQMTIMSTISATATSSATTSVDKQEMEDVISGIKYDISMHVEDIMKVMTLEEAEQVEITAGTNSKKKIREVCLLNYRQLKWIFNDYDGENNIMKAAAMLVYNHAEQQLAS